MVGVKVVLLALVVGTVAGEYRCSIIPEGYYTVTSLFCLHAEEGGITLLPMRKVCLILMGK